MRISIGEKLKKYQNDGSVKLWGIVHLDNNSDDIKSKFQAELNSISGIEWIAGTHWCVVCENRQENEKSISSNSDSNLHAGVIGKVWSINKNRKQDADLVAHLYAVHRENIINQCDGQFAAVVIDEKNNRAILTVNWPGGFHKLYYCTDGNYLAFSNRLEILINNYDLHVEVNEQAIVDLFRFGGLIDGKTLIKGVNRVMPGFSVIFEKGNLKQKPVYKYPSYNNYEPADTNEIERIHREAIEKRISGCSEFGLFLSGGLDSGMNVAAAADLCSKPVKTFTVGFDSDEFDESPYAKIVADKYNTEHYKLNLNTTVSLDRLPEMVWAMQEPIIDYSYIPSFYVAEAVKQYVDIAIGGDGPDFFLGRNYQYAAWYDLVSKIFGGCKIAEKLVKVDRNVGMIRRVLWQTARKKRLGRQLWQSLACTTIPSGSGMLNCFCNDLWGELSTNDISKLFSPTLLSRVNIPRSNIFWSERWNRNSVSDTQYNFILTDASLSGLCGVFEKVGSMCSAHNLVIHEPYLSTPIISYFLSISNSSKVFGSWKQRFTRTIPTSQTKVLLRQMAKSYLPNEITLQKKKHGFEFPLVHCWLQATKEISTKRIFSTLVNNTDWFNINYLDKIVKEQESGQYNHRYILLLLAALDQWFRIFIKGDASRPAWKWSDCF